MATVDWLADVLRTAGVQVVEYPGWRTRSAGGTFAPRGVIWHHDASALGPSPSLPHAIAEVGNSTTPPPLAQAWVAMDGTWHLTAAGRANHAGIGAGWGRIRANRGNEDAVGVETDHTVGETWPAAQLTGLRAGTAAILRHLGASPADSLCGHKEYAPGRKVDPAGLDLDAERRTVAGLMDLMTEDCDMTIWTQEAKNAYDEAHGVVVTAKHWEGSNLQRQLGFMVEDNRRLHAELAAAVADGDLDPEVLAGRLETAAREAASAAAEKAVTGTVLPALRQVVRDVLGEDNTAQADAIVDRLAERLQSSR